MFQERKHLYGQWANHLLFAWFWANRTARSWGRWRVRNAPCSDFSGALTVGALTVSSLLTSSHQAPHPSECSLLYTNQTPLKWFSKGSDEKNTFFPDIDPNPLNSWRSLSWCHFLRIYFGPELWWWWRQEPGPQLPPTQGKLTEPADFVASVHADARWTLRSS